MKYFFLVIIFTIQVMLSFSHASVYEKNCTGDNLAKTEKIKTNNSDQKEENNNGQNSYCEHCLICQLVFITNNVKPIRSEFFKVKENFSYIIPIYNQYNRELLQPPKVFI